MLRSLALSLFLAVPLAAADPKLAITDLSKVDADFATQGEYLGERWHHGRCELTGLQVVALGDGQFQAVMYPGGLPGWGHEGQKRSKFSGATYENSALLSGDAGQIRVPSGGGTAVLSTLEGERLCAFHRVHRESPTLGLRPDRGARTLFDGGALDAWDKGRKTGDGLLMVGTATKEPVGDFRLHLEFRTPYMPGARGQGRGNSGVYIQGRYEVQILDSFGLEGLANECGGLYTAKAPEMNLCLPPLSWQTYDIEFTACRFSEDGKTKVAPAKISVRHNGYSIHRDHELANKTGGGEREGPAPRPIKLQDHGNPVVFRNIWIAEPGKEPPPCECVPWFSEPIHYGPMFHEYGRPWFWH